MVIQKSWRWPRTLVHRVVDDRERGLRHVLADIRREVVSPHLLERQEAQ